MSEVKKSSEEHSSLKKSSFDLPVFGWYLPEIKVYFSNLAIHLDNDVDVVEQ